MKNKEKLGLILKKNFPKNKIPLNIVKLKINDLNGWDSLGNFNLLLSIEDAFKVRFSEKEINTISSCKEIIKFLNKNAK